MSYYERRIEQDLAKIRAAIAAVSLDIEQGLRNAVNASLTLDKKRAYQTILGDLPINRAIRALDQRCHRFIAVHLPSAGYLRFISSVMRLSIELERIGDYAVTICRESVQLSKPLEDVVRREVERMAMGAIEMYQQSVKAFLESNVDLARGTKGFAKQVSRNFNVAMEDLAMVGSLGNNNLKDLFSILVILNRLSRIGDQAKNICEEAIYAGIGETKPPKIYKILFLDRQDGIRSRMAVEIARKAFPNSGHYTAATLSPLATPSPTYLAFMQENGFENVNKPVTGIDWPPESWDDYHVLVSLDGPMTTYLDRVPYSTVSLEWEIPLPTDPSNTDPDDTLEATYRALGANIRELMETMRGEDAD